MRVWNICIFDCLNLNFVILGSHTIKNHLTGRSGKVVTCHQINFTEIRLQT